MADQQAVSPNTGQIEFWNSAASRAWADQYERMDRAVADLTKALLDMAAPQKGEHVLDIGCGSGTTVLELAAPHPAPTRRPGIAYGHFGIACMPAASASARQA
jgi:methylase of polypeptide subunit release factors